MGPHVNHQTPTVIRITLLQISHQLLQIPIQPNNHGTRSQSATAKGRQSSFWCWRRIQSVWRKTREVGECRGSVYTSCKCVPHAEAQQRSRSSLRKGSKHPNEQPQGTRRCSKHTHRSLQSIPKVRPTRRRTMSRCCNQPLHNEGQLPTGSNTQAESGRGIRDRNRRPKEGY